MHVAKVKFDEPKYNQTFQQNVHQDILEIGDNGWKCLLRSTRPYRNNTLRKRWYLMLEQNYSHIHSSTESSIM